MGALSVTHERAFTELLSVDVIRGHHSTGMVSYNSNTKNIRLAKEVGSPPELIRSKDYTDAMSQINRLLIGHNRYATKGKINKENAHPFKQGNIVGAHNGSLSYMGQQRLEDKDHKFDTDSEAIMWSLSTRGFDETWRLLANPVFAENAFALTWFDANTNKFFIVKNKKRPLYYAYTEKEDAVYWASELGALQWIMFRNGLIEKEFKAYSVNDDTLYEWNIVKTGDEKVTSPKLRKLDIPEPLWVASPTYYSSSTTSPFDFDQSSTHNHRYHQRSSNTNNDNVLQFPSEERVRNFRPPYKSDKGFVIGKKFITTLTDQGCFYCGEKNFKWGEFGYFPTFGASNTTEFLCKECYLDNDIKQIVVDCSNA